MAEREPNANELAYAGCHTERAASATELALGRDTEEAHVATTSDVENCQDPQNGQREARATELVLGRKDEPNERQNLDPEEAHVTIVEHCQEPQNGHQLDDFQDR